MSLSSGDFENLLLSSDILEAERYTFPPAQTRFLLSRAGLRRFVGNFLGKDPSEIVFDIKRYGKPVIVGIDRVDFNLSHSDEYVVFCIANEMNVGIDIESHKEIADYVDVASRVFSPAEINYLRSTGGVDPLVSFYNIWVRKEALLKAIGCGLSALARRISIVEAGRLVEVVNVPDFGQWWLSAMPCPAGYYAACVCSDRFILAM